MAYPGEGYNMSNYGLKTYSPEQIKEMWRENTHREAKINKLHPTTKFLAEKQSDTTQAVSYYNNNRQHQKETKYDQTFHIEEGYNQKLKRDDMQHTQVFSVWSEEKDKSVPILSNSIYGTGTNLEFPTREYVRVAVVRREFYRPRGINIKGQN